MKKTVSPSWQTATARGDFTDSVAKEPESGPAAAYMVVKKVVRECIPLRADESVGKTFGALVDQHIEECLMTDVEIQSLEIQFDEDRWNEMRLDAQKRLMGRR